MERFKKHPALLGKDAGCIIKLRGKVMLVVFLVDDAKSKWDDLSEKKYSRIIQNVCLGLMKESGLPWAQLNVTYANRRASVPYEVTQDNAWQLMRDVLQDYYCDDSDSFQDIYKREMGKDEVCVSFVLNRPFISYAHRVASLTTVLTRPFRKGNEFSVVSFRKNDLKRSEQSLLHELLHQFGAIDLYKPQKIETAARKHLPGSIMNDGDRIDPLTRYVIGWDDALSPEAIAFLEETAPK